MDGLPQNERGVAFAAVAIAIVMGVIDGSIANVALPTMARELGADPASSIWIVNAYQVASTTTLIAFASLGDIIGYRRLFTAGLVVFTLASLGCALSGTLAVLVTMRAIQGLAASAFVSIAPAINRSIFPSAMLGRAVGYSALTVASSAAAGPTLAGAILAVAPWPWLFSINVPLGVIAVVLAWRYLPRTPGTGDRFDVPSALIAGAAITLLVVGLDRATRGIGLSLAMLATAGILVALFVARQRGLARPMLPLDIFAAQRFSLAALTSFATFAAQGLAFVALPFLLQEGLGVSAFTSGLLFTPWPLTIAIVGPIAGRLADRYPAPVLSTAGLVAFVAGLASLALLPEHASVADIVWRGTLCGLGFGFFQAPNNRELLGSVPRSRSGAASGILATMRVTGQSVGAAIVAIALGVAGARVAHDALGANRSVAIPAHAALWIGAGIAAFACAISASRLRYSTRMTRAMGSSSE